jgi:hypothetical protein
VKPETITVPIKLTFDGPGKAIHDKLDEILAKLGSTEPPEPLSNNYVALQNERDHWLEVSSQQHEGRVKAEKRAEEAEKRADILQVALEEHHEVHGEERVALINRNRKLVAEVVELQRQLNEERNERRRNAELLDRNAVLDTLGEVIAERQDDDRRVEGMEVDGLQQENAQLQRRLEAQKAHIQQQADTITRRNEDLRRVRKRSHNAIVTLQADIGRIEEEAASREVQIESLKQAIDQRDAQISLRDGVISTLRAAAELRSAP